MGVALKPFLAQLVPVLCQSVTDAHPRVRYSALYALGALVSEFKGESKSGDHCSEGEEDDTEHEQISDPSFQETFHHIFLPEVLSSIHMNCPIRFPHVLHCSLRTLSCFCDSTCESSIVASYSGPILDFVLTLLTAPAESKDTVGVPLFVSEQALVVASNLCSITSPSEVCSRYSAFMTVFRGLLGDLSTSTNCNWDLSQLRGRSLECFAIMANVVGVENASGDAIQLIQHIVSMYSTQAAHGEALTSASSPDPCLAMIDFSDPLASFITQACAR